MQPLKIRRHIRDSPAPSNVATGRGPGIQTRCVATVIRPLERLPRDDDGLMQVEGVTDFREAVVRGAQERLVPILMTAMAAGLALIPLALGGGKTGSEIQTPMAIVILCGLTTSTLLNMFVVPTLYLRYAQPVEHP
jgi:AcrB/AcrD/AcrF family protein